MDESINGVYEIYDTREKYIIIGLTGRTGSGCSTAARILSNEIGDIKIAQPKMIENDKNELRKFLIVKRFIKDNWKPFVWIKIKDIITSFILEEDKEDFIEYVTEIILDSDIYNKDELKDEFFKQCGESYDRMRKVRLLLKEKIPNTEERHKKTKEFYFGELPRFSEKLKEFFDNYPSSNYAKVYQKIGDNIRSSGCAISSSFSANNIFSISKRVNRLLKIFTYESRFTGSKTYVVVDTLRNPYEALYFRERYSAFYLMAINTNDSTRKERLQKQYDLKDSEITTINKKESHKFKSKYSEFVSQNIQKCYDLADIHVSNPQLGNDDYTYLEWQLVKFVSLIMHPGIIMPSSIERCMQVAHTAKLNSGCLSRQVGACITNGAYSVQAIGWNTPPEGQAPCSLRNVYDLLAHRDDTAFSKYENNDNEFRSYIRSIFESDYVKKNIEHLKGSNVSYCFKDIKNIIDHEKNQVHTRALHAEENAFLC